MRYIYSTVQSVRDLGVSTAEIDDLGVFKNIQIYGNRINKIIGKVFTPMTFDVSLFCNGKLVKVPGSPVIKVNSLHLINSDGFRSLIDQSYYEVKGNILRFHRLPVESSWNPSFMVEMNYIAGLLENRKDINLTITSAINEDNKEFTVDNASDLDEGDSITVGNRSIICRSIDYTNNLISIDKQYGFRPIPSGTTAKCYGAVPIQIERVIGLFVKHRGVLERSSFIKSETIGKYRYELFGASQGSITGVAEIDNILNLFINDDLDIVFI